MKAVVLAAGRGSRLRPLTDNVPKAMIPINGTPMLLILIEQLKQAGIREVVIVTHYLAEHIRNFFGKGSRFGVRISYAHQEKMLGTANAVLQAKPYLSDERFICVAGDSLFEKTLLSRLLKHDCDGVITCREVEDGRRYGVVVTDDKKVIDLIEKPMNPPTNLANLSVYLFPYGIFAACESVPLSSRNEYEVTDAIRFLIKQGSIFEYEVCNDIIDIGTSEEYARAQELARELNL